VDIGGTFTDVVAFDSESQVLTTGKTLSTPKDLIEGALTGLRGVEDDVARPELLVHGSTVVINALIERKGAKAALVTTEGFRDVYEIGRINRPDSFNLFFGKHRPLIPRHLVYEVPERLRADGGVLAELDEARAREVADELVERGVEAVAVCFLHAYKDPVHEIRMGEILRAANPDWYVTLSHEITREYREFERTSTVAANAFVGPVVSGYLGRLENSLRTAGSEAALAVMQSGGGVADVDVARRQCIQMIESGPAGGVVGTIAMCGILGYREAIAFDMGGTTAKASVIRDLTFPQAADLFVGGYHTGLPMRIPALDIVEVGTGGGSVAWIDDAGGMHVGPRSAGAEPGPACYGRGGTEATVTDASVVLGYLSATGRLSGGLDLDGDAARRAVDDLAARVGMDRASAAAGIVAIAASSMANAIRAVTTERGLDPRDFALVAYGGNGPLHISPVARELGIERVVVPPIPSVFSALGMLMADLRHDVALTDIMRLTDTRLADLEDAFRSLEEKGRLGLVREKVDFQELLFVRSADMRYVGQEHTVTVTVPAALDPTAGHEELKRAFDAAHLRRFSHSAPEENAEIVTLRVSVIGRLPTPQLPKLPIGQATPPEQAMTGRRGVLFDPGRPAVDCPVYERERLLAGNVVRGPAVVEEGTSTTLLYPGDALEVDPFGSLLLTIEV
jgi:N-methylhydantoinase A